MDAPVNATQNQRIVCWHKATGFATSFRADVTAVAKQDLAARETLDGEDGYTVSGGLRPASISVGYGYLHLGMAHNVTLKNTALQDQAVTLQDVEIDTTTVA